MVLLLSFTLIRALKKRFYSLLLGKYRILGRVVHLKYVKEQLEKKQGLNYDFSRARQEMRFISKVEIQTDSLYVEVSLKAGKKLSRFRSTWTAGLCLKNILRDNWNVIFKTREEKSAGHCCTLKFWSKSSIKFLVKTFIVYSRSNDSKNIDKIY